MLAPRRAIWSFLLAALLGGTRVAVAEPPPAAPGAAEPAITVPGVEGDYLRAVHTRIHDHWARGFVAGTSPASASGPGASGALADKRLRAVVLFAVRWDGTVAEANIGTSSGLAAFDRAAVDVVRATDRFSVPPVDLLSDDGLVHFRWALARDQRLCSDGELVRREDPLEEALPRLFVQGRMKEALLRVKRRIDAGGAGDPMALFARAWLARPNIDPIADVEAAAILARQGDGRQSDRLRAGLAFPVTTATAVSALRSLKADFCAALLPRLASGDAKSRLAAASILRDAGEVVSEQSPCAQALIAIAGDGQQPGNLRATALQTLEALAEPAARRLWPALIKESDPAVRAAAVAASARPSGGRPALYRLIPYLRDPSLDVRAAAAAGMVRSAGDLALDQFAAVLKDPDPRVAVAIARELAHLPTPAAAALLGRLSKRDAGEVRVAAAQALATRSDAPARALLEPIIAWAAGDPRAPAGIRALAAKPGQPTRPPADPEVAAFRALLADHKHAEAAAQLAAEFDRTPQRTLVGYLGAWLENPPTARLSTTAPEQAAAAESSP